MTNSVQPRLIRPSKDGQEGDWAYLLHTNGHDFIFPAQVDELGNLQSLFGQDEKRRAAFAPEATPSTPADPSFARKVIYWKASEWETKLLPLAVEWIREHNFEMPPLPFYNFELRKIEDRGSEDRVTEVLTLCAYEKSEKNETPCILFYNFKAVEDEEASSRKPLLQWWMEGILEFSGTDLDFKGNSVPYMCDRISQFWSKNPPVVREMIDREGMEHAFKLLTVHGSNGKGVRDEEMRLAVMFIAFCRYIASLKTRYEENPTAKGIRRQSIPRTTEEALALEQATIFKTVGVLRSGVRKKPVATGTGTKHRYRYLVRGHERIINGKSIWVKPQIRGQGEFLNRSIGTTEEAVEAAKVIEPPQQVVVNAPEPVQPEPAKPEPEPLVFEEVEPAQVPAPEPEPEQAAPDIEQLPLALPPAPEPVPAEPEPAKPTIELPSPADYDIGIDWGHPAGDVTVIQDGRIEPKRPARRNLLRTVLDYFRSLFR